MKIHYLPVAALLAISALTNQELKAESILNHNQIRTESLSYLYDNYDLDQVKAIVKYLLSDIYHIPYSYITDESYLMNDLGLDSLDMLDFTNTCFEFFNINTDPDDVLSTPDQYTVYNFSQMILNQNPS
ncbi:MAG: hypothetical protein IJU68_01475 [Bacteroidales bacterium]|nr:hypothetical protein [Bacteroidales bacterium]